MSKRERARRRSAARDRRRWLIGGAVAVVLLGVGLWVVLRPGSGTAAGGGSTSIAAYNPRDMHALVVSLTDERTVTFGHHGGMLVSRDAGTTWSPVSGSQGKDAMGLAAPAGSQTVYAAGHDVLLRSDDGGQTWASVRAALPGTDLHGFAASATQSSVLYAFVAGLGLYTSEDAGKTWRASGQPPGSTMSIASARSADGDVLFAATMDQGVVGSRDGGKSWQRVPELAAGAYVTTAGDTVYVASGSVVLASRDGGQRWERRSFARGGAMLVAVAPTNAATVYVVTDKFEVWRSTDGGANWQRAS